MVAASLLERDDIDAEMYLFEKNSRLWAKVIISGGGRCNVTTGFFKKKELLDKYPRGAVFLETALEKFWPRAIRRWFEAQGVPLKEEEDHRIFPVSDDGKDIVAVFEKLFRDDKRMHLHLKEWVLEITPPTSPPLLIRGEHSLSTQCFIVTTEKGNYEFDAIVLTTGGNAYAHTGSSGDGYAWARNLGHSITRLWPSLNSFLTAETWLHSCSGNSFADAILKISHGIAVRWPILLTHFGISWPATFAFSSHIPYEQVSKEQPFSVLIQVDALYNNQQRQQRFVQRASENPKKELGTLLRDSLTKKFVEAFLLYYRVEPHTLIGNLRKDERLRLASLLGDGIPLSLIQRRPGDEFVTAGGVCLDEVDEKTGESKICPWLYFAGEILDVDGYTGGYNLTSSWALGRLVGKSIQ